MLYFRRICLLVALALTFGASDVFAQGAPPGISVKIVQPADSAWVGIGGKIVVDVESTGLLSGIRATSSTDTAFLGYQGATIPGPGDGIDEVLLYIDSTPNDKSVAGAATRTLTGHPGNTAVADPVVCRANYFHNSPVVQQNGRRVVWNTDATTGGATPGCKVTAVVQSFQGGKHIARYTFEIKQILATVGSFNFRQGVSGIYAVAAARVGGPTFKAVANVETGGDGKFVKIDTGRPSQVAATHFDSVGVSGKIAVTDSFKIGDKIELVAGIRSLVGASDVVAIELGLFGFHADYLDAYMASRDSALVNSLTTFKVSGGEIQGAANNVLRRTVTVEENAFKIVSDAGATPTILMDDLKFKVAVFFVDRAGNIGAEEADATAPEPYSAATVYVVDSKKPKITIKYPVDHPDSNRFTGLISKEFRNYRNNANALSIKRKISIHWS